MATCGQQMKAKSDELDKMLVSLQSETKMLDKRAADQGYSDKTAAAILYGTTLLARTMRWSTMYLAHNLGMAIDRIPR